MSLALNFICPLLDGVHARPAGALAAVARSFLSEITLTNLRTGQSANSKSMLAVLSAGIRSSDACRFNVSGTDETFALSALAHFLAEGFSHAPLSPRLSVPDRTTNAWPELFDPRLIVLAANCRTKSDAIHQAVQLLATTGRTEQPAAIEHALWEREAVSATAVGHGFAIPHCQSRAVLADSLVILKPQTPLVWAAPGQPPVNLILLMAVRETARATAHLQILSQLARKLMDASFRRKLDGKTDAATLCQFLQACLPA